MTGKLRNHLHRDDASHAHFPPQVGKVSQGKRNDDLPAQPPKPARSDRDMAVQCVPFSQSQSARNGEA